MSKGKPGCSTHAVILDAAEHKAQQQQQQHQQQQQQQRQQQQACRLVLGPANGKHYTFRRKIGNNNDNNDNNNNHSKTTTQHQDTPFVERLVGHLGAHGISADLQCCP
ncbi:unnamed protein product [Polarella glacialis]|uniref:Uncharacterized protein n=1 Tax=Polarella glacialis TaxID=89957 RepID=A0A813L419_POLGL|nr:unnamed protein product [Polarella glacialis]